MDGDPGTDQHGGSLDKTAGGWMVGLLLSFLYGCKVWDQEGELCDET